MFSCVQGAGACVTSGHPSLSLWAVCCYSGWAAACWPVTTSRPLCVKIPSACVPDGRLAVKTRQNCTRCVVVMETGISCFGWRVSTRWASRSFVQHASEHHSNITRCVFQMRSRWRPGTKARNLAAVRALDFGASTLNSHSCSRCLSVCVCVLVAVVRLSRSMRASVV